MKGGWPLHIPWSPHLLCCDGMYQWASPPGRAFFLQWLPVSYRVTAMKEETDSPPSLSCSRTGLQVCSIPCSVPNKGSLGLSNSPGRYHTTTCSSLYARHPVGHLSTSSGCRSVGSFTENRAGSAECTDADTVAEKMTPRWWVPERPLIAVCTAGSSRVE